VCTFILISHPILLRMKNASDKIIEKIKTHVLCSVTFSPKLYSLWDNLEKYGTARQATNNNIIWSRRCACWISKATNTICSTYCFYTAVVVMRLTVTLYVRCLSCSLYYRWIWQSGLIWSVTKILRTLWVFLQAVMAWERNG